MNITLRQLAVFEATSRHLSFTKAAVELHLTQPAVSMQVKLLESQVGLPLFELLGRKIYLTEVGRELQAYSRRITRSLSEFEDYLDEIKGNQRGQLAVSVATTASHFATRLLADFSRHYEGVQISLDVTNRETLYQQLSNNETDMVIMGLPPKHLKLESKIFMDNPLVLIAPTQHPLCQQQAIPLNQFAEEKFVVREEASGTRHAIERFFSDHNVPFNTGMEMTSNEAIKQAVGAGLGLGIVSLHTLELELKTEQVRILDVTGLPIMRHWYITHCKEKRLSPIAETFKRFVLKEAQKFLYLPPELTINHLSKNG